MDRATGPIRVSVAVDRCTGCQQCVAACAGGAVELMPDAWAVQMHVERCTGCRKCICACPFRAITVSGPMRNRHRVVLDCVHEALARSCPPGWRAAAAEPVLHAEPAVAAVAPDVTLLRVPQRGVEWLPIPGPPIGLVVEVMSPSSRARDLGPKRELYWRSGVPTYWTVDQLTGRVAVQWSRRPAWFDPFASVVFG
jgi:NAD-dependent dihydropyrimidine dehydrogenase PreA subunit